MRTKNDLSKKWHCRFLNLAKYISQWSKDPSTQVGAVLAAPNKRVISIGFNGFPMGIEDDERLTNRELKYKIIIHAERNALLFARETLEGARLYTWPMMSCSQCAAMFIQTSIVEVIAPPVPDDTSGLSIFHQHEDIALACDMYHDAGIHTKFMSTRGIYGQE